tara:strand:- start:854 stop:1447 length:594 start_codon:yes stop_codon:yes gene_type:complete
MSKTDNDVTVVSYVRITDGSRDINEPSYSLAAIEGTGKTGKKWFALYRTEGFRSADTGTFVVSENFSFRGFASKKWRSRISMDRLVHTQMLYKKAGEAGAAKAVARFISEVKAYQGKSQKKVKVPAKKTATATSTATTGTLDDAGMEAVGALSKFQLDQFWSFCDNGMSERMALLRAQRLPKVKRRSKSASADAPFA